MESAVTSLLPTVHGLGSIQAEGADEETALKAFDAYFLGEMLRRSAPQNPTGLFDGGQAGRMYRDFFYQEIARLVAEQSDFGIAKGLEGELTEKAESPAGEGDAGQHTEERG